MYDDFLRMRGAETPSIPSHQPITLSSMCHVEIVHDVYLRT